MVLASAVTGTVTAAPAAVGAAATLNGRFIFMQSHFCKSIIFILFPQLCIFFFLLLGQLVGDCVDDQFSITGGLSAGTPTICGTNTGYHSKSEVIFYKINMVSTNETRQRFDFSINFTDSNDSDCES